MAGGPGGGGGGDGKLPPVDHDPLNEGAVGKIIDNKYCIKFVLGLDSILI